MDSKGQLFIASQCLKSTKINPMLKMLISPHGSQTLLRIASWDVDISVAVKRSMAKEIPSANHDIDTFPSPLLYLSLRKLEGLQQPWAKPGREFP